MSSFLEKKTMIERLWYFTNLLEKTLIPLLEDYVKHRESAKVFYFVASFLEDHEDFSELLNRAPVALIQDVMEKSHALYYYLCLLYTSDAADD